ncbi:MAG TPA: 30S ribosomal protein S12 methylthiotransferase RimO [Brevefilum fermentans]|jgi:ribosomal protein S12 methylthiotransferase|uniref:Ribosomal protein uS12 methylthiotransferase RimO n=1 Tax=Candidatus Brevifilum fermentans TaxID=1986204 RepID=A0A1Y6K7S8_9CHLR|nr:30S ribosomal protein S12 methylthiotransferase RimO [Brevefilum fermentans]MDI9566899.1 30S ribosomal protein S12 methylthiotransferase RimO [Chloroflexota bacterium]OQB87917.1 MAG: Ribosomal protein S12 methylthiotransferase RimO [Chloroflexi bacterium ADurb.Bin120]SMX54080.1 Ribosomal protein S12 methylthiotransferase RimO [Brevefilum fermentans]HOM67751.1 30S ribosomal protein S12 methylthiotransferase RimO [Brevefilum fermentans]HPX95993.1 30S ribosomal protein S12 methylthiotransferas
MTKQAKGTYHLVSLGCPKNLVDSESMSRLLNQRGLVASSIPEKSEYLIVNTCGFLTAARREAITILRSLVSEKQPWQKLIATGCMPELHRQELLDSVPGLDGILGTRRWMDILDLIDQVDRHDRKRPYLHCSQITSDPVETRRVAIQGGSAYLKIADGCRRSCSYCLIPLIKGNLISRPIDEIIKDAKALQDLGIKEIILIAQDTTDYGHDLGMQDGLTRLLEALLKAVPHIPWIRLLYAFPGYVTDNLIQLMKNEAQVLPYLDIPLQHADPAVLRAMRRPSDIEAVSRAIAHIRAEIEGIALRTTMIVGFPGEDDLAFQRLVDFVQTQRFDHLGTFAYSFEPGAPAEPLGDPISEDTKADRVEQLMHIQAEISLARNQSFIDKVLDVIIEGIDDENRISIGRSYRDAPEIDGLVIVEGIAPIGEIVAVKIHSAITYDLIGKLV